MERVYNFSAGPSMLPLEVLEKVQKELVCYGDSGMSVMEMSHRSKPFEKIIQLSLIHILNEKGRTVSIILYIKSNVSRLLNRISESIGKGFCLIYLSLIHI